MKKKSQIWVEASIYLALGIIILTLVIGAGVPVINKLRDKNTVIQTKELMSTLDNNIREVVNEGPGSRRQVRLFVRRGEFTIDELNEGIQWEITTKALLSEPGIEIPEANLVILTKKTPVKDEYETKLWLNYTDYIDLDLVGQTTSFIGTYDLLITNIGIQQPTQTLPTVTLEQI